MPSTERGSITIEGHTITITNPLKPLWPELGVTKMEYLQTLGRLAPYLLTYCRDRYLTTIRFPHGVGDKSFYQKNAPEPTPEFVRTAVERREGINYVVLDNLPTLIWLGNLACLEFHPSLRKVEDPLPAEWVLDIDPSQDPEPRLMEAVLLLGDILKQIGIAVVPKTSGASGIQLWARIRRGYTFDELRKIGEFVAGYAVNRHPGLFTVERLKARRGTKIYIDYMQHGYGKTIAAPYTPRARPHGGVSTPLTWEEVERLPDVREYNLRTVPDRLDRIGDLLASAPENDFDAILDVLGSGKART